MGTVQISSCAFWTEWSTFHMSASSRFSNKRISVPQHSSWLRRLCDVQQNVQRTLGHLQEVFDRIHKAGLNLKPYRYFFLCTSIIYLGHVVEVEWVSPDSQNWKLRIISPHREMSESFSHSYDWCLTSGSLSRTRPFMSQLCGCCWRALHFNGNSHSKMVSNH